MILVFLLVLKTCTIQTREPARSTAHAGRLSGHASLQLGGNWGAGEHPSLWYGPSPAKSSLWAPGAVAKDGLIRVTTTALVCTFMVLHHSIKPMFPLF